MTSEKELLAELIEIGADAVGRGLILASGGNLSVRLPGERFAVTASGTWLDRLTEQDFAIVDLSGTHLSGPAPSSEWKLHQRAYLARPDANCVIHLHPKYATLLATMSREIKLVTLDHAVYVGSYGVNQFHPNGSDELADDAARELAEHNCVVMQHHGCSVVADTTAMAYRRALNLEHAAEMTLLAAQAGGEAPSFPPGVAFHA